MRTNSTTCSVQIYNKDSSTDINWLIQMMLLLTFNEVLHKKDYPTVFVQWYRYTDHITDFSYIMKWQLSKNSINSFMTEAVVSTW